MKTASADLHDLLMALTASERRYVRLHLASPKGLGLMDAMLKQKNYDESALKKKHPKASFIKNFSLNKQMLYEGILELLSRSFSNPLRREIDQGIQNCRFLLQKKQYKACQSWLKRIKKSCQKNELYEQMLEVLRIEKQVLARTNNLEDTEHHLWESKACLADLANIDDAWQRLMKTYHTQLHKKESLAASAVRDLKLPAIKSKEATSLRATMLNLQATATAAFTNGQKAEALECNAALIKLFEEHPRLIKAEPERYLAILNNYLIDCFELSKFPEVRLGIEKLKSTPQQKAFAKVKGLEARVFRQSLLIEANMSLLAEEYEVALLLIPQITDGLERYKRDIAPQHKITLSFLAASILFANDRQEESLDWVNMLLEQNRKAPMSEFKSYVRLLNLLLHFELNHVKMLENLIPSSRRQIRSLRALLETEKLIYTFLQNHLKEPSLSKRKHLDLDLRERLLALSKEPSQQRLFSHINLLRWIELRVSKH